MTERILYEAKQKDRESLYKKLMDLQTLENQGIRIPQRMIDEVYDGLRAITEAEDLEKLTEVRNKLSSMCSLGNDTP
jgi:hypothetical protein